MSTLSYHQKKPSWLDTAQVIAVVRDMYHVSARLVINDYSWWLKVSLYFLYVVFFVPLFVSHLFSLIFLWFSAHQIKKGTLQLKREQEEIKKKIALSGKKLISLADYYSLEDYIAIKETQDYLSDLTNKLQKSDKKELNMLPYPLRVASGKSLTRFRHSLSEYVQVIEDFFKIFDAMNPPDDLLVYVSEQELWEQRNKAYEYRM